MNHNHENAISISIFVAISMEKLKSEVYQRKKNFVKISNVRGRGKPSVALMVSLIK